MCYSGKCPQEDSYGDCTGLIENMCYYDYQRRKKEEIARNKINGKFMTIIIDEGSKTTRISVRNEEECINELVNEYCKKSEVTIGEMLESVRIEGFSLPTTVKIYSDVMNKVEGDFLIHLFNCEKIEEIASSLDNRDINFYIVGHEHEVISERAVSKLEPEVLEEPLDDSYFL